MNVANQEADLGSTLHFARTIIALRKARAELSKGGITLHDAPEGILAFSREHEGSRIDCLFNMDTVPRRMPDVNFSGILLAQDAAVKSGTVELGVSGFCLLQA